MRVVRGTGERLALRVDVRTVAVSGLLLLLAGGVGVVALATGEYTVPIPDVLSALAEQASGRISLVVVDWRLPRVLLALLLGAALGASGAIFQSLTRNPLGSPDVIDFNTGAYTGALIVMILLGGGYAAVASGALVGGIATAAAVYLLAYTRGVQGFRLIVVGIAVASMLSSANAWLIVKAELDDAMAAAVWGAGSLNGLGWAQVGPMLACLVVLTPVTLTLGGRLATLELGDDAARALGLRVEPLRLGLIVVGVALTAMVTAAAGPIAFIALAAPQLARRLTGAAGAGVVPAAAMGALLLVLSDWTAQRAFAPTQVPVGAVTVAVGGAYLIWLLVRQGLREGRGV